MTKTVTPTTGAPYEQVLGAIVVPDTEEIYSVNPVAGTEHVSLVPVTITNTGLTRVSFAPGSFLVGVKGPADANALDPNAEGATFTQNLDAAIFNVDASVGNLTIFAP